jgi:hypothetical protein
MKSFLKMIWNNHSAYTTGLFVVCVRKDKTVRVLYSAINFKIFYRLILVSNTYTECFMKKSFLYISYWLYTTVYIQLRRNVQ